MGTITRTGRAGLTAAALLALGLAGVTPGAMAATRAASPARAARYGLRSITVGGFPSQVAVDSGRKAVWAATGDQLVRISERTQRVTAHLNVAATFVAVDPRTATVWAVSPFNGDLPQNVVTEVSERTDKVMHRFTAGPLTADPEEIAADPATGQVWVVVRSGVAEVSEATHQVLHLLKLPLGPQIAPFGITIDPRAGVVWVQVAPDGRAPGRPYVAEISERTRHVLHRFNGDWSAVAADSRRGTAWLAGERGTADVVREATGQVTRVADGVPAESNGIVIDPAAHTVVAAAPENTVDVISESTGQVTGSVRTGFFPAAVTVDPATGCVYAPINEKGNVAEFHL
jgi:DNA-binding beta-propeller fold protein YncE